MRRCYQCDAVIVGRGYRQWVTVGTRTFASAGISWRSIRSGGGTSTGLRTLCADCAASHCISTDRRQGTGAVVCLAGLGAWIGGNSEAAIVLLALGLLAGFSPQMEKWIAWVKADRAEKRAFEAARKP